MDIEEIFTLNKPAYLALSKIYGIGFRRAEALLLNFGISPCLAASSIPRSKLLIIKSFLEKDLVVDTRLHFIIEENKRKLAAGKCFRGIRLVQGLPTRGQRTKSNARTQKARPQKQFKLD